MSATAVVEDLDVLEDFAVREGSRFEGVIADELFLQSREDSLVLRAVQTAKNFEDFTSDVSLEAAEDFWLRQALIGATLRVEALLEQVRRDRQRMIRVGRRLVLAPALRKKGRFPTKRPALAGVASPVGVTRLKASLIAPAETCELWMTETSHPR